jgi:nitroreductase
LAYAITAPNPHNLQPWTADLRDKDVITIRTDRTRVLPHTDPFGRQILIGHGAFLELLLMALAERGFGADVTMWPEGELDASLKNWDERPIARVRLLPGAKADALFAQILKRHTVKSDYDMSRPVSGEVLAAVMASADAERFGLKTGGTVDPARLDLLRQLCWQSAQVELLTPRTVMESMALTRVGPAEILEHRDGISLNDLPIRMINALGLFDRSQPPAKGSQAEKTMLSGFVWVSGANQRSDQVDAGRAYVRLQLKATELGLGVHPMSQALQEFAEMAPHYAKAHQLMLGLPAPARPQDATVQMFCRIGYAQTPALATPRRPMTAFVRT